MPTLIFLNAPFAGRAETLQPGTTRVGRSSKNDLVIADESLSASHCEFLVNGFEVIVRDSGSRNGTFVNGVKVVAQAEVREGQVVRLGLVEVKLQREASEADEDSTEVTAVHAYARSLSGKSQAPTSPVAMHSAPPSSSDDRTFVLPAKSARERETNTVPAGAGKRSSTQWRIVVYLILALCLAAVVVWYLLR